MGMRNKITGVVTRPFKEAYEPAKESIDSIRSTWEKEKDPEARKQNAEIIEEMRNDFSIVMKRWGFTEAQRPKIIRNLRIDGALCCGLALLGLASVLSGLGSSFIYLLAGTGMFMIGGAKACACFWRADVLKNYQFETFKEWAFGSFSSQ